MTEHEKLKEICDKIGYETKYPTKWVKSRKFYVNKDELSCINVREIIFTQEFMDKYIDYTCDIRPKIEFNREFPGQPNYDIVMHWINLNNPTDYLYELIK